MPRSYEELFPEDEDDGSPPSTEPEEGLDYDDPEAMDEGPEPEGESFGYQTTDEEVVKLEALGERRDNFWLELGYEDVAKVARERTSVEIKITGAIGEHGACKILGMPFNWEWDRKDPGYDGVLMGLTVQVKSTKPGNRWMVFYRDEPGKEKHFSADIAVMATVDRATNYVKLIGWFTRKDFEAYIRDRRAPGCNEDGHIDLHAGYGYQPGVHVQDLRSMETLAPMLARYSARRDAANAQALFVGARDEQAISDEWEAMPPIDGRRERWREDRERRERERHALFLAEQRRRKERIEAGEYDQPEAYKGRVFDRATNQGVAYDTSPPYRDDPFSGLTEAFVDFQTHHHMTRVRTNPENYCTECKSLFAVVVCPFEGCRSARVDYPKADFDGPGMRAYHCRTCRRGFEAERVCGSCRSKRPEVQARLRLEADQRAARRAAEALKPKSTSKAGTRPSKTRRPRQDEMDFYPD